MAKAARSLSPKQIAERERQHRFAVIHLARYRARKTVEAALRDQGRRVTLIPLSELRVLAQAELELNRISLIAEAEKTIATSPLFARYRLGWKIGGINLRMLAAKVIIKVVTTYGYARVSTDGQTLASQEAQLIAAGCAKVYSEKVSGARTDRIELAKVLKRIEAGDMLVVTRLDRLARSTRDLLNILHDLKERGAGFKSLADPWCDTGSMYGELLVTVLAGFATFERQLIKARTDDGRKRAKARACVLVGRAS